MLRPASTAAQASEPAPEAASSPTDATATATDTTTPAEAHAAPPSRTPSPARTGPRDPNDRPPLPPPNGQPAPDSLRHDVDHTSPRSNRTRVLLTAAPMYASFRLPMLGRPSVPVRGFGFGLAAQVRLLAPFGLRLTASHTVHPVFDEFTRNDDDALVHLARRGLVQATHVGGSVTFEMDLGRVLPTLDAGVGAMWIRPPGGVRDGQLDQPCLSNGACDFGLVCGAEKVCVQGTTPQIHGGFAVDVLLRDHFAVGAELRYFALLSAPTSYPVYLVAALRSSLRF